MTYSRCCVQASVCDMIITLLDYTLDIWFR